MSSKKFLGSTLILIGTTIGAGMLALPLVSASAGFVYASIGLVAVWALMTISGLLVLEVNMAFDRSACGFSTMAHKTLGNTGKVVAWIACLLLLYALTAAYMAGAGSLLSNLVFTYFKIKIPNWISVGLFTILLGSAVYTSTSATDFINRGLISFKGIFLVTAIVLLIPHIDFINLVPAHTASTEKYLLAACPIFLCAFGYHTVIPSIRMYIGDKPRELRKAIILSSTISLLVYLIWLGVSLGIVLLSGPKSFSEIATHHGSVGEFIQDLSFIVHNNYITAAVNGFSNVAITTSFLGVTLGLFDFLADGFKRKNTKKGRMQTALLTYVPPIIFAIFYPDGFVVALGYATICVAVLGVIMPSLMVYSLRRKKIPQIVKYQVVGGDSMLVLIALAGLFLAVLQVLSSMNLLSV
jgi:tyrosine-specific transport protein